jgi:proteasome lid subunit RPN8/RPN11
VTSRRTFKTSCFERGWSGFADWHSHPWRDPIPSPADIRNWARASEEADVFPYAGVIPMPGEDVSWMAPKFVGWVISEDDNGVLVCEPAVVEER